MNISLNSEIQGKNRKDDSFIFIIIIIIIVMITTWAMKVKFSKLSCIMYYIMWIWEISSCSPIILNISKLSFSYYNFLFTFLVLSPLLTHSWNAKGMVHIYFWRSGYFFFFKRWKVHKRFGNGKVDDYTTLGMHGLRLCKQLSQVSTIFCWCMNTKDLWKF